MEETNNSDGEDSYARRMRKKERKKRRKEEKHEKKKKRKAEEERVTVEESPQKDEPANVEEEDALEQSPSSSSKKDKKSRKKQKKESVSTREDDLSSSDSQTQKESKQENEKDEENKASTPSANETSSREPKYIGVNKHKIHGYYETKIIVNKKVHFIGNFASAEEAAHAYDKKALELKGPTAKTNFDKHGHRIEQPHSSKYVGVALHKDRTKFKAYIRGADGKVVHLGVFEDEKEAALVYDKAARELRGSKAKTNFPPA